MHDEQVGGDAEGHRQGGPHPVKCAIATGALDDGPIGPFEALAKLGQELVLVVAAQVQEPFERVQDKLLDAADRQSAGEFAGRGAAHAVGDDHQVPLLLGELRLAFSGQAGLAHAHRLRESGNQEMILVVATDLAGVGQGTELDRHPRRLGIGDGLELTGRVVDRGTRLLDRHGRDPVPETLVLTALKIRTLASHIKLPLKSCSDLAVRISPHRCLVHLDAPPELSIDGWAFPESRQSMSPASGPCVAAVGTKLSSSHIRKSGVSANIDIIVRRCSRSPQRAPGVSPSPASLEHASVADDTGAVCGSVQ